MELIFRRRCRLKKKGHGVNTVTLFSSRYMADISFIFLFFFERSVKVMSSLRKWMTASGIRLIAIQTFHLIGDQVDQQGLFFFV